MFEPTPEQIEHRKACLLAGERVITNDAELDIIQADDQFPHVLSLPNPNRVGTLDVYVAWISPQKPAKK